MRRSSPARWAGPLPGVDGGHRRARRAARAAGTASIDGARRRRRAGPARRLAVDVPRLPRTTRALPQRCFADGWYLSGDLATRDADGYFWFVGRADDVIKSAGHLIGPFEVESALRRAPGGGRGRRHRAAGPVMGELVKAFVSLKPGFEPTDGAAEGAARRTPASASGRRSRRARSSCGQSLPRTRSGKILRRLLKARELGLPEGDLSTLEACAMSARARPSRPASRC
jgi:acetyl-CoA synthetase